MLSRYKRPHLPQTQLRESGGHVRRAAEGGEPGGLGVALPQRRSAGGHRLWASQAKPMVAVRCSS